MRSWLALHLGSRRWSSCTVAACQKALLTLAGTCTMDEVLLQNLVLEPRMMSVRRKKSQIRVWSRLSDDGRNYAWSSSVMLQNLRILTSTEG